MDVIGFVEADYPVDQWRVGSVDLWPVARVGLGYALFRKIEGAEARPQVSMAVRLLQRARSVPTGVLSRLRRTRRAQGAASVVFLADGRSYLETPTGLLDRHCDPLRLALEAEGTDSLLLVPGPVRPMSVGPTHPVQVGLDLAVAQARLRRPLPADLPGLDGVQAELRRVGLTGALSKRSALVRRAGDIIAMADHFERLLERTGAQVALVSEYYSAVGMALVLAARRAGIASVDIQHGVQGPLHFAYAAWTRLPDEGSVLLPDWFWVWSSVEVDCIARWAPEGRARTILGGNAFLEASTRGALPGADEATRAVDELIQRRGARRLVVVALSGREADSFVDEILGAASRCGDDWLWAVRSHPTAPDGARWVDRAKALGVDCIETDQSSTLPLFALLARATAVVTRFSTVTLDAAALGVPTVLVDPLGVELFADQIASGVATAAELEAGAILDVVRRRLVPAPTGGEQPLLAGVAQLRVLARGG